MTTPVQADPAQQNGVITLDSSQRPFYQAVGNEEAVFRAAFRQGLSLVLKGPTGCGKTRFVEAMAYDLGRPLITVSCHDDLTTADLVGRYLLQGDQTVWVDGPLTRAVREGAICYLDEVVEARQDTTVVLHPLGDHRRQLPIERLGVTLDAAPGFCLVVSYNPGYQSVLKDLKDSTRQRMVAIDEGPGCPHCAPCPFRPYDDPMRSARTWLYPLLAVAVLVLAWAGPLAPALDKMLRPTVEAGYQRPGDVNQKLAEANAADPVLRLIEQESRRATLIARRERAQGTTVYHIDIRLQGDNETVFFDV